MKNVMMLMLLSLTAFGADYSGCGCCHVNGKCDSFSGTWSTLYQCLSRVENTKYPSDPNWFHVPRQPNMTYQQCTVPTGWSGSQPQLVVEDPCDCFETMSDSVTNTYDCSNDTDLMEALDEVCNNLKCKFCNFVDPKCGAIQQRRCDMVYQQEIALHKTPSSADICRALSKKTDCYDKNNCTYSDIAPMQQTIKQCRNSTCPSCYQICKNGAETLLVSLALAVLVLVF
ncbi:hypothetical protein EIN_312810 [Entamoeba invadens IP1]|uniref:Uncharacterized protein n=1 Tax=Entamoeba invadens IP1 TaxID=370355 RepID=A0A0A1UCL4_ENTIV|nr:hypothetical protein EIN_312810 [Entamoeba invadens IP1]ELP92909.1 hypothetical protein EIN_312810 [Entamoeba invadens IP1]|eukprot:XP_004259680.1 hypothetical protein EIN_312810 [Entamoeba invadens IP1]